MELYFITGNKNKFNEVKEILDRNIKQLELDLLEIQELDPKKIISEKLKEAMGNYKGALIVEDTSLYIEGLNGLPGPLIKWFLQTLGIEGLYKMARDSGNTKAKASTMIGYYDGREIRFIEGSVEGEIVPPSGKSGFGWDPIFKPANQLKTYQQMTLEEKNKISHRGKAFLKLKELLDKEFSR